MTSRSLTVQHTTLLGITFISLKTIATQFQSLRNRGGVGYYNTVIKRKTLLRRNVGVLSQDLAT